MKIIMFLGKLFPSFRYILFLKVPILSWWPYFFFQKKGGEEDLTVYLSEKLHFSSNKTIKSLKNPKIHQLGVSESPWTQPVT